MDSSYIIESQYFPCIDYIKILKHASNIKIERWENFQKSSYRNRCTIAGSNGLINLTVPVVGGREQKNLIKDMKVDYSTIWNTIHCRSIKSSYARSPFYEYYSDQVFNLINSREKFLLDFNLKILNWIVSKLKINTLITYTSLFNHKPEECDMRNQILPGKEITTDWAPQYYQVFRNKQGFQPNLSILDLLFCEGPNASNLISEQGNKY